MYECRGLEAKRIPAIMHHPEYKKDPWATIRLHASNSIAAKGGLAISGEKREGRKQVVMDGAEVIND